MDLASLQNETRYTNLPPLVDGWSNPDYFKLLRMYEDEASLETMAVHFSKSKGQIAGLIHRACLKGLVKRHTPVQKAQPVEITQPKEAHGFSRTALIKRLAASVKKRRVRLRLIDDAQQVTFAQLEPHHCRWPFGDPRQSDFRFCGCRRVLQKPYCEAHVATAGRLYERQPK